MADILSRPNVLMITEASRRNPPISDNEQPRATFDRLTETNGKFW